ncbi:hypothetical protein H4582DRAFT_1304510 [Lactarius indigo]|nr:hypothetical protein H4582DRAFT_1304510 [Lactarius indigo]
MAPSNDMAALTGFVCEALAYGVHGVLFALFVMALVKRKHTDQNINTFITISNVLLFLVCTAHFVINFHHFYTTLRVTGGRDFAAETKPLVIADFLISLADLIGDSILIYRCWLIWVNNYLVTIIPSLCAMGGFACVTEVVLLLNSGHNSPIVPASFVPLAILRGISTPSRTARRADDMMIESGSLYMATQVIFVTLVAVGHPAQSIIADIAVTNLREFSHRISSSDLI